MNVAPVFSDSVYEIYALWEMAREKGEPFNLENYCTTPSEKEEAERLIAHLAPARPAPPEDHPLPSDTERYRFVSFIARGGMGDVYRCEDLLLKRTVAIKVLRRRLGISRDAFRAEAQLAARLSHPGIVPVHDFGELPNGRMYFAMKLVEGETLETVLGPPNTSHPTVPRWLQYFEQICQTVAYAHGQTPPLLHRDLKPQNVMIGAFGEVQVMDWGIAKILPESTVSVSERSAETTPLDVPNASQGTTADGKCIAGTPLDETETGVAKGTWAYMAPEQARGEKDRIGPTADVFGLGGILCRMLTGKPTFHGDNVPAHSTASDLAEPFGRLDRCGAEPELIALAKRCLAPNPYERYPHAAAVAEAVQQYQDSLQQRLLHAQVEQAKAKAQAEGERRRRRLQFGLAASVLVLLVGLGLGGWWWQGQRAIAEQRRQDAERKIEHYLDEGRNHLRQGQTTGELNHYDDARAALDKANEVANSSPVADPARQSIASLASQVEQEKEAARRGQRLLAACMDVRQPQETKSYRADEKGHMLAVAEPTADQRFANAFRAWGLDVESTTAEQIVERLHALPAPVAQELVAALDEWWQERRDQKPPGDWRKLFDAAEQLDQNDLRRNLRHVLASGQLKKERLVNELSVGLMPAASLLNVPIGPQHRRLREVAAQSDVSKEPVLGMLALVRAMAIVGDATTAEKLLRQAITIHPDQVLYLDAMGLMLAQQKPPRWTQAIECWRALRSKRPETGIRLGQALSAAGRATEAVELIEDLRRRDGGNPELHHYKGVFLRGIPNTSAAQIASFREAIRLNPQLSKTHNSLAILLHDQNLLNEAEEEFRAVIRLDPKKAVAHNNLGSNLEHQKKLKEAEEEFRIALRLDPHLVLAHNNLGLLLRDRKKLKEAEVEFRTVIRLDPQNADAHTNLGLLLRDQMKLKEAEEEHRTALHLNPRDARAHYFFGALLHGQQQPKEAEEEYLTAIRLDPEFAQPHYGLGVLLVDQNKLKEAEEEYRTAIRLDPNYAAVYNGLGNLLRSQKNLKEAEEAYRTAIRIDPQLVQPHIGLGNLLRGQKKLKEAEEEYRTAIRLDPQNALAHYNLGNLLKGQKKLREAEDEYRTAIRLDPQDADFHERLGLVLRNQKRLKEAEAEYRTAIHLDPQNAGFHDSLGDVLRDQKRLKEAEEEYRTAIGLNPIYATAYNGLGLTLEGQKKLKEAEDEYRTAIRLDSESPSAHFNLARLLHNQNRLNDAEENLQIAIRLDPEDIDYHSNLGDVLRDQKRLKEAEKEYRTAIYLGSQDADVHINLGVVLEGQNKVKEAEEKYRTAIGLDPQSAIAHYNLGNLLKGHNKLEQAEAEYRTAIRLDPMDADYHYNLGLVLQDQKKFKAAEEEYRTAIRLDPQNASTHFVLGNLLGDQQKLQEAEAAFRSAICLNPDEASFHHHLALVLIRQKKLKEAIASFQKADQLSPNQPTIQKDLRDSRRWQVLDARRTKLLDGTDQLEEPGHAIIAAVYFECYVGDSLSAVRFYRQACQKNPKFLEDSEGDFGFTAALSAIRVLHNGQSGAIVLDLESCHWLNDIAYGWAQANLKMLAVLSQRQDYSKSGEIRNRLSRWRDDESLACVRDPASLAGFPEPERNAWQRLWKDVDDLLKKLDKNP